MNRILSTLYAAGLGAGLMYFFDPDWGNRRRSLVRDKAVGVLNDLDDMVEMGMEDARNRVQGMAAETRAMFSGKDAPDPVLEARARAELGRVARFPGSIEVTANDGRLTLSGPILKREVDQVVSRLGLVRGVKGVENRLTVHDSPEGVPGLQGNPRRREPRMELLQENWSPATRLLASTGGSLLGLYGLNRGGLRGALVSVLGFGTALRGMTNLPPRRLLGYGGGRQAVEVNKAININAPVERVYELWSNFANFPRFMAHVKEVREMGEGRSHWKVAGPAGSTAEWDAVVTRRVPHRILAWKSVAGEPVQSAGIVRFDPNPDGSTRVSVRLAYNPPAGAVGHAVASLFGADPKTAMDEDLVRLKSLLETGKTSAEGQEVRREDVTRMA